MTTISFADKAANHLLANSHLRNLEAKDIVIPLVQELADKIRKMNLPAQAMEISIAKGPLDRMHACFNSKGELVSYDLYQADWAVGHAQAGETEWRAQKPTIYVLSEHSGCTPKTSAAFRYLVWRFKNPPFYCTSEDSPRWTTAMKAAVVHTLQDSRRIHVVDIRRLA
jgi:hypothetical protein